MDILGKTNKIFYGLCLAFLLMIAQIGRPRGSFVSSLQISFKQVMIFETSEIVLFMILQALKYTILRRPSQFLGILEKQ